MLETYLNLASVVTGVISFAAGFIGGYLSIKLKLKYLAAELESAREDLRKHDKEGHQKQFDAVYDELLQGEGRMNKRVAEAEAKLPNCEAHKMEFVGKLEIQEAKLQTTIMTKVFEVAEQNSRFREEVRQRVMTDAQQISKETLSPDAVLTIVRKEADRLRADELKELFHRVGVLEKER